jgi:hypothetical protein
MNMIRIGLVAVLYLIVGISIALGYVISHENVHVQICEQNKGVATIGYLRYPYLATTYCNVSNESMRTATIDAEIVGYNLQTLIASLYLIFGVFLVR